MALLDALADRLNAETRGNRYHADCPCCGKEVKRGQNHFSFDGHGFVCWVCGTRGSLSDLARRLSVQGTDAPRAPRPAPTIPAAPWTRTGALESYRATMAARWDEVVTTWQAYKPLTEQTIKRADLGLGLLPLWSDRNQRWYQMRYPRLLAPLIQGGQMVGVAGRAYLPEDDGPKWITASTSRLILHGLEEVNPGDTVIWVENRIDRLLVEQAYPEARCLASGGLTWQSSWLDDLARRRPRHVLCWFDNDIAGCPNPPTYTTGRREWEAKMRERVKAGKIPSMPKFPEPRGPKLANELRERGIDARVYRWPIGTPAKYDIGSALIAEMRKQAA